MKRLIIVTLIASATALFASHLNAQELLPKQDESTQKFGFVDEQGKLVIPYQFDWAVGFYTGGFSSVCVDGKWGAINKAGKLVVPYKYKESFSFERGFAIVKIEEDRLVDKYTVIDTLGREILPCIYRDIRKLGDDGFIVSLRDNNNKTVWGYFDKSGKEIVPCLYYAIDLLGDGIRVSNDRRLIGLFDKSGNQIIPFEYDGLRYNVIVSDQSENYYEGKYLGNWVKIDKHGRRIDN